MAALYGRERVFQNEKYPFPYPRIWSIMQPTDLHTSYEPFVEQFAVETIFALDLELQNQRFIEKIDTPWAIAQAQSGVVEDIVSGLRNGDAGCVAVLHGVIPAALEVAHHRKIQGYNVPFAPTMISGYHGTKGGIPVVLQPIPEEVSAKPLVFGLDDMGDRIKTMAALLREIERVKLGIDDKTFLHAFAHLGGEALYDEFIDRMHKAGLVASLLFYKNMVFAKKLEIYLHNSGGDMWSVTQRSVFKHARLYDTSQWIVGWWVDLGLSWGDVYPEDNPFGSFVDEPALRADSVVDVLINQLSGSMFRLGTTMPGMYGFYAEQEPNVRRFAAEYIADRISWFARCNGMR